MHAGQILSDDSERKQLRPGEQRDDRGEKRETRDRGALQKVSYQDITENAEAEQRKTKANETRDLQRFGAEAGRHVQGVRQQLAEGVAGRTLASWLMADGHSRKTIGAPGQEHINRDEGTFVVTEGVRNL